MKLHHPMLGRLIVFFLLFAQATGFSQVLDPVKWSFATKRISETEYELLSTAKIEKGWYTYSQYLEGDDGPVRTSFNFEKGGYQLVGKSTEESSHRKEMNDPLFDDMKVIKFAEEVTFRQKVKVTDPSKPIKGYLEFMTCDNEKCLPPKEVSFSFVVGGATKVGTITKDTATSKVALVPTPIVTGGDTSSTAAIGTATDTSQLTPEVISSATAKTKLPNDYKFDQTGAATTCEGGIIGETVSADTPLWQIFIWGFLGGLLAILMPCIFPLIPLTVSYFTKSSTTRAKGIRNALWYGFFIVAIYVGLGMIINALLGADALNQLSTNVWFNIGLFVMLVLFAFSFFGYFELTLPSSWANKSDRMADKGGLIGIFFMAFTLVIVSFSCTGPLIGNLLVLNAKGGILPTFTGMFAFGLALALPFALFSAFPAWLHSLPRSGSWMDDVKVTLGFAEIALALKFLSVADLTMGWKVMPYEAFVGMWVLCGLGLAAYFSGWLKFPHSAPKRALAPTNLFMSVLGLAFAIYCATGFNVNHASESFITPNLLSGLAPPPGHSYIYPKHCPHDFSCYHDIEEGIAVAKREHKPILIDFTGYGCVNCRRTEDNVWSKPGVRELIRDKYVLVSLYVDERKALPEPYTYTFYGSTRRTLGHKWNDFEIIHFNRNSQPYYVLVDENLSVLNTPRGYDADVAKYEAFLKCGLDRYAAKQNLLGAK